MKNISHRFTDENHGYATDFYWIKSFSLPVYSDLFWFSIYICESVALKNISQQRCERTMEATDSQMRTIVMAQIFI